MTEELQKADVEMRGSDVLVVATNQAEMQAAQQQLIGWSNGRIASIEADLSAARVNVGIAKASGWDISGLERTLRRLEQTQKFHEKIHAALEQGYTLVPDMDIQLIAVRTNRRKPKPDEGRHWPTDQKSVALGIGEGAYVSPDALVRSREVSRENEKGEPYTAEIKWAAEFKDVDFPFRLAKPTVVASTAAAMEAGIFDEIGVVPHTRKGDPMVIGRIVGARRGWSRPSVSFLIAWFVDTRDLP